MRTTPSLNGQYTVFGEAVGKSMEVVDKIKKGEPVVDPGPHDQGPSGGRRQMTMHA